MYRWLWRHLPGPTPVRVLIACVLAVAMFFLLMEVVFPAVEPRLPYSDVSVGGHGPQPDPLIPTGG